MIISPETTQQMLNFLTQHPSCSPEFDSAKHLPLIFDDGLVVVGAKDEIDVALPSKANIWAIDIRASYDQMHEVCETLTKILQRDPDFKPYDTEINVRGVI